MKSFPKSRNGRRPPKTAPKPIPSLDFQPSPDENLSARLKSFGHRNEKEILLIIGLGFLVFLPSLFNGFVSDDLPLLKSPYLKNPFQQLLDQPVSAFLNSLSYTLNFAAAGDHPFGYHLVNLLLHLLVSLTVLFLVSLFTTRRLALLTSLFFLTITIHSEAVVWVSGRHYLLYSFFVLGALILYLLATRARRQRSTYLGALFFFIAAVYSFPEQAFTFPLILAAADLCRGQFSKRLRDELPFWLLTLAFVALSLTRVQSRVESLATDQPTNANFMVSDVMSLTSYFQLFFWPAGLSFYHEYLSLSLPSLVARSAVVLAFFFLLIFLYFRNRLLLFFLLLIPISLLPTLTPLRVAWVVAERYFYLGALGLCFLLSYLFIEVGKKFRRRTLMRFLLLALLAFYSWTTFRRNFDWKDEDALWLSTVKASPTSSKAWNNIGDYYGRHGEIQKSFDAFKRAVELNPGYADAWHNAGNVLLQAGQTDKAIPYFEKSLEFNPTLIEAYNNLALSYHRKGDEKKVDELLQKSLQINPQSIKTHNLRAVIEFERHHFDAAKEALLKSLNLDPQNQLLQQNLLILEKQKQQWEATTSQQKK